MDNIDISTSDKGKTSVSTNGIKAYSKEAFGDEIHRLIQTNIQLAQNKQNSDVIKATIEANKNRFISEKNVLVVKHEELRREVAAFQRNAAFQQIALLPFIRLSNQRTREIAFIFRRNKLKVYIPDAFDRIKGTFKRFLI